MGLNLDEYIIPDEEVTIKGKKFIVTAHIPYKMMQKFQEFEEVDEKNPDIKTMDLTIEWLKAILYLKNDSKDVDWFIEQLDTILLTRLATFISEFIKNAIESKKKINSKT